MLQFFFLQHSLVTKREPCQLCPHCPLFRKLVLTKALSPKQVFFICKYESITIFLERNLKVSVCPYNLEGTQTP